MNVNYKKALKDLKERLEIEWFVIGSANLALQGINVTPSNLGILIHHTDLEKFLALYSDFLSSDIVKLENGEAQEFTLRLHGVEVIVCAEYEHGIYWEVKNPPTTLTYDNMKIPCFSLYAEREAYKKLQMHDKIDTIDSFIGILRETKRTLLKKISQDDLKPLAQLFADPAVMEFSLKGPFSFERSQEILKTMIDNNEKYGFGACAVIHKETGKWMGFCGLWWDEEDGELKNDFGYRFFKEFWGQGYATESVTACLQYISKLFPNLTINSYIEPKNTISLRVAKKTGMHFLKEDEYYGVHVHVYQYDCSSKIIYREAVREDCAKITQFVDIAAEGALEYLFGGLFPGLTHIQFIQYGMEKDDDQYTYKNVIVAEYDGNVIGALLSYPSKFHCITEELKNLLPKDRFENFADFFDARVENSWYIDTICVDDNFQGQGIGSKLITLARKRALENGYKIISLLVYADNLGAQKLYKRHNFEVVRKVRLDPHELLPHEGGFLLMSTDGS